jgi:hypothetical protein
MFGAGGQWAGRPAAASSGSAGVQVEASMLVGQWASGQQAACWDVGRWVGGLAGQRVSGMLVGWWASVLGVATRLFFQCIIVWRSLPPVRDSGCQSLSSS